MLLRPILHLHDATHLCMQTEAACCCHLHIAPLCCTAHLACIPKLKHSHLLSRFNVAWVLYILVQCYTHNIMQGLNTLSFPTDAC